jgi:hypothetical protein
MGRLPPAEADMASSNTDEGCGSMLERIRSPQCIQPSLRAFRPKFLNDLIRVGPSGDGGYVLNARAVLHSRYLMSFGLNDDWAFELAFLDRKPDVKVFCYDHSVSKDVFRQQMLDALSEVLSLRFVLLGLTCHWSGVTRRLSWLKSRVKTYRGFSRFIAKPNVRFCEKGISNQKNMRFVTFGEAFQAVSSDEIPENSVFVKMDIEQSEFRVLPDLQSFDRYINGLVIEFHDLDILWPKFVELVENLKARFEITHVHGNNWGGLIPDTGVPTALEITFLKKDLICEERSDREDVSYPVPRLDYPNKSSEKDYHLSF